VVKWQKRQRVPINDARIAANHGTYKYARPHYKNMHPSVKHLGAKGITSENMRIGLRKWNVFWVRINRGKIDPKGARDYAKKPKFDKRERDIWEPKRDAKPSTRQDTTNQAETPDDIEEN
jgi:hypothetical protein